MSENDVLTPEFDEVIVGPNFNCVRLGKNWGLQHRITRALVLPCAFERMDPHPHSNTMYCAVLNGNKIVFDVTLIQVCRG